MKISVIKLGAIFDFSLRRDFSNGPRPIVAKIDSWKVKERIVKKAREVKTNGLKFYSDFSQRTLDRRRSQIPALQAARNQGKDVFFVVDRLVFRNKRNDWHGHGGAQWDSTPNEGPGDAANSSAEMKFSLTQFPVTKAEGSNYYHYECEP